MKVGIERKRKTKKEGIKVIRMCHLRNVNGQKTVHPMRAATKAKRILIDLDQNQKNDTLVLEVIDPGPDLHDTSEREVAHLDADQNLHAVVIEGGHVPFKGFLDHRRNLWSKEKE
jgi:hypothetical protein